MKHMIKLVLIRLLLVSYKQVILIVSIEYCKHEALRSVRVPADRAVCMYLSWQQLW